MKREGIFFKNNMIVQALYNITSDFRENCT